MEASDRNGFDGGIYLTRLEKPEGPPNGAVLGSLAALCGILSGKERLIQVVLFTIRMPPPEWV